eukprot:CAMPEP_0197654318 /NCGR_PEP_ID=MMETSP1338-20131121/38778_1 /TAXON_ID=43686 ORGANISM="Pelagodinium beii, Strain RCC1491" /NCGR_SAMPLE_ID=MMETSP1338 /ASSEMBLY_ACC=CAM_ASM_000754 /LENGTH=463 /DNA_ID=CAMNT_0043229743 /DNA_START=46 /DNA_END=1434 /DNA_ORIENTATION=+
MVLPPMSGRASKTPRKLTQKDRLQLHQQALEQLWEEHEIPLWHRELYTERYFNREYPIEVLSREVKALSKGTAVVQRVMDAIANREELLVRLTILRTAYDDADFMEPGGMARRHLSEQLDQLRNATLVTVEALCDWRLSVALRPGKLYGSSKYDGFAGPISRGAWWPYAGPTADLEDAMQTGEDYLLHLARDDTVVKSFENVLFLAEECDPFLYHFSVAGTGPFESGKLCPPPADSVDSTRLEAARLRLLEEEMSLVVFKPSSLPDESSALSLPSMSSMVRALTAPLELPDLGSISISNAASMEFHDDELEGEHESFFASRRNAVRDTSEELNMLSALVPLSSGHRPSVARISLGVLPEFESVFEHRRGAQQDMAQMESLRKGMKKKRHGKDELSPHSRGFLLKSGQQRYEDVVHHGGTQGGGKAAEDKKTATVQEEPDMKSLVLEGLAERFKLVNKDQPLFK